MFGVLNKVTTVVSIPVGVLSGRGVMDRCRRGCNLKSICQQLILYGRYDVQSIFVKEWFIPSSMVVGVRCLLLFFSHSTYISHATEDIAKLTEAP